MTREEYLLLYERYLANELSPEQEHQLLLYEDDFEMASAEKDEQGTYDKIKTSILFKLNHTIRQSRAGGRGLIVAWFAAASILLVAGLILVKRNSSQKASQLRESLTKTAQAGRLSPKISLTFSNGKTLSLSENSIVISHQGRFFIKNKSGQIANVSEIKNSVEGNMLSMELNTLTTSRGGQYQLDLADGTKVWLNAASSLKFPSKFAGKYRDVELSGEAYFEVAKNKKMPFRVKFDHQQIEVLGTHFDIKAYEDEDQSKSTLIEGRIRLTKGGSSKTLNPGEQALTFTNSEQIQISKADAEEAVSWKNGYFIFHDESIQSIMRTAARWYDIDVVYEGHILSKEYGGRVSKYQDISELLRDLELTGTIHFSRKGRRITVME